MTEISAGNRLDRPVDEAYDHILGDRNAAITLVEYGSYDCPHCRAANERIGEIRSQFGDRLRYVFRHRPLTGSDIARRAAELVEHSRTSEQFWNAHVDLMTRSQRLTDEDLGVVAGELGLENQPAAAAAQADERARARVAMDIASSRASGVAITPTFFINGRRYDGPWDESSFADAMLGSLGHRVRSAALDFASWAPSTGLLLLLATVLAVFIMNSGIGLAYESFWTTSFGISHGGSMFEMPLRTWVNDGLLTVFFLIVGLEIKREFTVGHLASRRSAALPIAGAIGGMVVPALLYGLVVTNGSWSAGWGVPMATDTAFAVALIVMLGHRVPVELRIFLTAAAIVDDIGAILVVALFYSEGIHVQYLLAALSIVAMLALLNRSGVYRALPYGLLGIALWFCVHEGGLHATLAGVVLALFIPTRPPPDLRTLMLQASTIINTESQHGGEVLRRGPSLPALQALDAIHDRLESPADRMLRHVEPWSSYFVLPIFALANAGVMLSTDVLDGHAPLVLAIMLGLTIGKPLGVFSAAWLAVRLQLAVKPTEYSWMQLLGAGALAGIGFTMSLFIAGQAFRVADDFTAAKIAVFAASILSAILGIAILWRSAAERQSSQETTVQRSESTFG